MSDVRPPALAATAISSGYGKVPVLDDVTVEVRAGEIVAVVGPNGAGKTTLLRTLCGELSLFAGRVERDGLDISRATVRDRLLAGVVHVPEHRHLFRSLTVSEHLDLGAAATPSRRGAALRERSERVLDLLPALRSLLQTRAGALSGGEQQMLALGRALMADPQVLLLDEPSLGLAPAIVERITDAFVALATAGTAVLLVEQFVESALEIATRGYVLRAGRVQLEGPSDGLLAGADAVSRAYFGGGDEGDAGLSAGVVPP